MIAGVSFVLEEGGALALVGPNGAGKSTLIRALASLLPLAGGDVGFETQNGRELTESLHYLGHADALKNALTARENLEFWSAALGGGGLSPRDALSRVGLPHILEFPISALSAGQKRRVAIARLLVARRPIWLLDEPTTALDAAAQVGFAAIVGEHLRGGGMVIAATHSDLGIPGTATLRLGEPARASA